MNVEKMQMEYFIKYEEMKNEFIVFPSDNIKMVNRTDGPVTLFKMDISLLGIITGTSKNELFFMVIDLDMTEG